MGKAAIDDEKCMRLESVFESNGFYQMFWSRQEKNQSLKKPNVGDWSVSYCFQIRLPLAKV